ncbi:MAG: hypothetical protein Kow0031_02680 [Anaerolineae bacterium]
MIDSAKVMADCMLAGRETVAALNAWCAALAGGQPPEVLASLSQQLADQGLEAWLAEVGGHGLPALLAALNGGEDDGRNGCI